MVAFFLSYSFCAFVFCRRQRAFSRKKKSTPSIVENQPAKVEEFTAIKNVCYEPGVPPAFNEEGICTF